MSNLRKTKKLREILQAQPRSKIKAGKGVKEGRYKFFTSSPVQNKYIENCIYDNPALIMGTGGGPSVHFCNTPFSSSTDCLVFYTQSNHSLKYIYYYLSGHIDILERGFKGAGLKHISKDFILNIDVPNLGVKAQSLAVATLDKASELISLYKKQLEELDVLAESVFYDMFGDPVKNEKGWKKEPLENIVAKDCPLTYGIVQPGDDFFNGVPIVRPVDLTEDLVKIKSLKLIDPQISAKFRRTLLKGGELLLSVRGTTGIVSLADKELNGCNVSRGITPIWFDNDFNILFAYRLFKCNEILNEIRKFTYGATLKQINLSDLRKIEVPTPPLPLQTQFATIIEKIEQQKSLAKKALQESEDLFQRLMQDLFKPD